MRVPHFIAQAYLNGAKTVEPSSFVLKLPVKVYIAQNGRRKALNYAKNVHAFSVLNILFSLLAYFL